jgi:hypothetical protein
VSPWLSIVIPTAGQQHAGLKRTLDSIRYQPATGDVEVLVVADTHALPGGIFDRLRDEVADAYVGQRWLEHDGGIHCYGQPQRSFGARQARGEWVAFSQDDNILAEDALSAIWTALVQEPRERPLFFRMQTYWRETVWRAPSLQMGNIDADCLVLPQHVASEITWGLRYEGDFDAAVAVMQRADGDVGWREEMIAIARPDQEHVWWS